MVGQDKRAAADHKLGGIVGAGVRLTRQDQDIDRLAECSLERRIRVLEFEDDRLLVRRGDLRRVDHIQLAEILKMPRWIQVAAPTRLHVVSFDRAAAHGRDVVEAGIRPDLDRPGDTVRRLSTDAEVVLEVSVGIELGVRSGLIPEDPAELSAYQPLGETTAHAWVDPSVSGVVGVVGATRLGHTGRWSRPGRSRAGSRLPAALLRLCARCKRSACQPGAAGKGKGEHPPPRGRSPERASGTSCSPHLPLPFFVHSYRTRAAQGHPLDSRAP